MKLFSSALLLLLTWVACLPAYGQLNRANKDYEMGAFNLAVRGYLELLEKRPSNFEAMLKLADSYRYLNQMEEARSWYERVLADREGRKSMVDEYPFQYAEVLMALEQYDKARQWFEAYAKVQRQNEENAAKGRQFAQNCVFAQNQMGQSSPYLVSNEYINTTSSDFAPAFYGDQVVFSSARTDLNPAGSTWTGKANNQLFMARVGDNGFLDAPVPLQNRMQDENAFVNVGPLSYGPEGRSVAFTKNNFIDGTRHIPTGGLELSIHIAQINPGGEWAEQKPFPYNGSGFSTGWPAFSPDGNALYFSSNRPDGFGGFDLYVSFRMGNTWSTPENLGPNVNTPGDEVSPFYDGSNLYFSSNWHQGLGGYDIFRAEQANGRWARVFHLGNLINSSRDDFGFIYDGFRNIGYLVSNRPGGRGSEDLYKVFKSADNITLNIRNASDGAPIPGATIDFINCGEGLFKADGRGTYSFQAVEGLNCDIVIRSDGFNDAVFSVSATAGSRRNESYDIMLSRRGEEYIGKILNYATRLPVVGVAVAATNQSTNSTMQATTDVNGDYALALSPNASYLVRYSRPGFRDISRTVNTGEGNDRTVLGVISMLPVSEGADNYPGSDVAPRPGGIVGDGGAVSPGGESVPLGKGYSVQVAALNKPGLENFSDLTSIGQVYSKFEGGVYKVRIGVFPGRAEAGNALNSVKSKGYKDAFIVPEEGNVGAQPKSGQNTPAPSAAGTGQYKVQLAAYRNPQYFNPSGLERYGNIEDRQSGGLTVKLLAGFDDIEEAKQAWRQAKAAGFNTAYIVLDTGAGLTKVYP
ncbi:MAG: carboxypeptidase regulatory-like domain-containing protein [Phaeodactylibacter sp.]|nr:carboxypeptidase regulatory-like domain-containing protein [Phaeodactylibacter sp.]MCB9292179.1 carboxypeptidase regulatory-like domain-containing protein [Lewinellaceae bacterium]